MFLQRKAVRHFQRRPQFVFRAGALGVGRTNDHVTRKRIALKHPIKRAVDFIFRNFPRDKRAIGEIGRKQRLPDPANRSRAQHGGDPRRHNIDVDAGAARDFLERLAHEAFDLVLRNGEDLGVDRIVMLDRQHAN